MNDLIQKLKKFIEEKNADALIVNSTNEFLVEYNQLDKNSRYLLTNFSGSTGDALLTLDKLYLFVDGRYHEQADFEVDHNVLDVVKLQLTQSYLKELVQKIGNNKKLLLVASKNSLSFTKALEEELKNLNSQVVYIDTDPIYDFLNIKSAAGTKNIHKVPLTISQSTADQKFEEVSKTLKNNESVVVTSLEDVAYFTNLRSFDTAYSSTYFAKMIIQKERAYLFTDYNVGFVGENFRVKKLSDYDYLLANIKNNQILIDEKTITKKDFMLIDSSNSISNNEFYRYKTIKNESEISHYKSAFERADKALLIVEKMINSSKNYSEYDLSSALEKSFFDNGALALSFKPIIASGKNSSVIHYSTPSKTKIIEEGDLILVDCGAYYEGGYATDITRTFVKGVPASEQKTVYTTVLRAFLNAYKANYTKESTWFNIDKNARDVILEANIKGFNFAHSTGHGVGISVHESPPFVAPSMIAKKPLQKNVVFTIEPGSYKEGWGGVRLENTVYIKEISDKVEIETLSKYKFEEKLIDYDILSEKEAKWLKEWQEMQL